MKEPIIALMYDFDKTLCTKDMQEYTFIPMLNMTPKEFWDKSNGMTDSVGMDRMLAFMYTMLKEANHMDFPITRKSFVACGREIEFYPGVATWFDRITAFGKENGAIIEHYIISSGLKEIIEGCAIGKHFKTIFACEYYYDANGVARWPLHVINYTGKTQCISRVNKGVLDLSNDKDLNAQTPEDERRVPYQNMIYLGDGMTDIPSMKIVHVNGGKSICVYAEGDTEAKTLAKTLLKDNRVNFYEKADYREGSDLDKLVKDIICSQVLDHHLATKTAFQKRK